MLNLLDKLKIFTNSNCNVKISSEFVNIQNIGIVITDNDIDLLVLDGSLKGHVLENNFGILELGPYSDTKDIILELNYNKIYTMINMLENMKALELTNEQLMGLSTLLPKS